MKIFNNDFISFDDFVYKKFINFNYKYLFLGDIDHCSFVRYLFIPVINGEIDGDPFLVIYDDSFSFKELYYSGEYVVYAINILHNYVVEVVDSLYI